MLQKSEIWIKQICIFMHCWDLNISFSLSQHPPACRYIVERYTHSQLVYSMHCMVFNSKMNCVCARMYEVARRLIHQPCLNSLVIYTFARKLYSTLKYYNAMQCVVCKAFDWIVCTNLCAQFCGPFKKAHRTHKRVFVLTNRKKYHIFKALN